MKLHLPLSLRSAIFALFAALVGNVPAQGAIMHSDASLITYTDFGQNTGRYKTTESANALLQHIRKQEGGVIITYTGGQTTYVMPHGMIDFGSNYHLATCAAISPSAVASCAHYYTFNSSFTGAIYGIGDSHAIQYKGIEIAEGQVGAPRWNSDKFSHCVGNAPTSASGNGTDHKVMRLSKVITDAPYVGLYDVGAKAAADSTFNLNNHTFYHAGSGQMWLSSYNTNTLINKDYPNNAAKLTGAHAYVIGGVVSGCSRYVGSGSFNANNGYLSRESFAADGINSSDPLTWVSRPGDSGSPLYVWDEASGTYQYIGSNRGEMLTGQVGSAFVVDTTFDKQVVEERYTKKVNMGAVSEVYLNAVSTQGETVTDAKNNTTTKWLGTVTGDGMETVSFVGLKSELNTNTWSDLSGLKDTQAWYAYDQSYVAQSNADLFFTENLVFNASAKENRIVLNDTVDLGIGYAEFNGGKFTISSAEGERNLFNHAGYVINAGAEVHLQLTNPAAYMREWRKIGAGHLYIEGSGNNDMLLNLGGSGKTYLNRTDGYAAYNVLVNTGATVVINDINQIKRDFTFGNRGGTLDMNDNTMDWYTTSDADGRFTINALTEDALVANYSGSSTLTYKEAGDTTYAGSFADSDKSSLKIVYDVAKGSWTLNSIRTNLQHEDSGLQVDAGRVILSGTNTVHGTGSAAGRDTTRYFHEDDWHYADAKMEVRVTDGGTFELGSHARLTGDVTVESGGTYVMREGVRHAMEYVEGGQVLEDTGKYAAYFGHKGDVVLNGGTFAVQFNDGVDATTAYNEEVKGTGDMTVDAGGDGGIFSFGGTVDAGVSKTLNRGQLVLTGAAAADTTNKWKVNAGGVMVQFDDVYDTLGVIDAASAGIVGLKGGAYAEQFDFSGTHQHLGIGALAGETIQYGEEGTQERLTTLNFGGGGKIEVNYALSGTDTLNVDGGCMRGGEVVLNNIAGDYAGLVKVAAQGGEMTLTVDTLSSLQRAEVLVNEGGVLNVSGEPSSAIFDKLHINSGATLRGKELSLSGKNWTLGGTIESGSLVVEQGAGLTVSSGALVSTQALSLTGKGAYSNGAIVEDTKLELYGQLKYDSFTVSNGGLLNLRGGRLDADNAVTIDKGGVMRLWQNTLQDKVNLENGGIMYGKGGTIGETASVMATEGKGTLNAGGGTFAIDKGTIGAEAGATLRLENGTFNIYSKDINSAGGTLELACSKINLGYRQNEVTQTIGGTLKVANDLTICTKQGATDQCQGMTFDINHLHIDASRLLTLETGSGEFRHRYNIASLTGSGTIHWKNNMSYFYKGPALMILTGDNDFSGTLIVEQMCAGGSMQHVGLSHENAAKGMVIDLRGDSDSRPGLAVSAKTAQVAGISGKVNTFVYAGAIKTDWNGNNPSSTDLNTLTINTAGKNHEYDGQLLGDETHGLNLVKTGSGNQIFSNSGNVLHDATALQGHLNFTAAPTIYGDVSIAQGAQMTIGSGAFSLNEGHTLKVLPAAGNQSAVLHNNLVLNGGTLCFESYGTNTASLSIEGVSKGNDVSDMQVKFGNTAAVQFGQVYWLSNQDWSSLHAGLTASTPEFLNASLVGDTDGLKVSFGLKSGYAVWNESVQSGSNVVFMGTDASIGSACQLDTAFIDSGTSYAINGAGELSVNRLVKSSNGDLLLNTAISIGTLVVQDDCLIGGNGSLSVQSLDMQDDMTTSMALSLTGSITNVSKHAWTLDGSIAAFTQQLSAEQAAAVSSFQVEGAAKLALSTGTDATLTSRLGGSGTVQKSGSGTLTYEQDLNLHALEVLQGKMILKGGVALDTLSISSGAASQIYNKDQATGAGQSVGKVLLSDNATLEIYNEYRGAYGESGCIGDLQIGGATATVKEVKQAGNLQIDSLSMGADISSATLNLTKDGPQYATWVTTFEFGAHGAEAGNFTGKVVLNSMSTMPSHSAFITLSGAQTLAHAVVSMNTQNSGTGYLGLGVNVDSAVIAGLESNATLNNRVLVFSGEADRSDEWNINSGEDRIANGGVYRTLTIDTAEGKSYTYHGTIKSNLNLVKRGKGTQVLNGEMSQFDGTTTVQEGTLDFATSPVNLQGTVTLEGGLLRLSSSSPQVFSGSIEVLGNAEIRSGTGVNDKLNRFAHIHVAEDANLRIINPTWNVAWDINSLTGTGTVNLNSTTSHKYTDRFCIGGDGGFSGVLNLTSESQNNPYQAILQIDSEWAISGATLDISNSQNECHSNALNSAAVALNADRVRIGGLNGGVKAHLFAGAAPVAPSATAAASTRNATLELTGSGEYTYSGSIGHADDTASKGVSIQKTGTGTQTFNGSSLMLNEISVQQGKLSLAASAIKVASVEVGQDAVLEFDNSTAYTLDTALDVYGKVVAKNARVDIGAGGTWSLHDGASIERTNEKSLWLKGALEVQENAKASFDSVDDIHLSYDNGENKGSMNLSANSTLDMRVRRLWFYKGAEINMESGASLNLKQTEADVTILKTGTGSAVISNNGDKTATLTAAGTDVKSGALYSMTNDKFTLTNAHLEASSDTEVTLSNKLTDSSVENAGKGLLTVSNSGNTLTGVHATKGDIAIQNIDEVALQQMEISAEKTITAANVVVSELAKLGAGATLDGNLTMEYAATVELGGTATLNGTLTLQAGLTLDGFVLNEVQGLAAGESYTLFTGVTGLNLTQSVTLYNMRSLAEETAGLMSYGSVMDENQVSAADYFSNLVGYDGLVLSYNSENHTVIITQTQAVPEPTTATLSLLALAALAARRKRK